MIFPWLPCRLHSWNIQCMLKLLRMYFEFISELEWICRSESYNVVFLSAWVANGEVPHCVGLSEYRMVGIPRPAPKCHQSPPPVTVTSQHPPPAVPECPLKRWHFPHWQLSSQSAFFSVAIIITVMAVKSRPPRGGTYRDCLSEGLERWDVESGVKCTWQLRDTGAVDTCGTEARIATVSELPAGIRSRSCSCLCRRTHCPVCLVALNSKLFLESTAYEELGVYIENRSW